MHAQHILSLEGELQGVKFDNSLTYDGFEASGKYLIWYEIHNNVITIYDLEKNEENTIKLKKGRGPNEFLGVMGIVMDNNEVLNVLDPTNIKFLRVHINGKYIGDATVPAGLRPLRVAYKNGTLVVLDAVSPEAVFYIIDDYNDYQPIVLTGMTVAEEFPSPFRKLGYMTVNENKLVHLLQYYPYLYVYDLKEKNLLKKIEFDKSNISDDKPVATPDGAVMHAPPAKVDILSHGVVASPGQPDRILILAEGKTKSRDYKLSNLYEYDLNKEKFVAVHELGVKAAKITANDGCIFVYSEEEQAVYQYKFTTQN